MNETNDMIKANGFDGFRALPATRKRFVLSVASGIDPAESMERISPHLTKGSAASTASRYMKEPRVIAALQDIQRLKDHNIDISYNKQVERFFALVGLIHQQGNLTPKHLELIFKIYQELNRMAGHMKNEDGASINFTPVQIIVERPEPEHTNTLELSETIETSYDIIPPSIPDGSLSAIVVEPPTNEENNDIGTQ